MREKALEEELTCSLQWWNTRNYSFSETGGGHTTYYFIQSGAVLVGCDFFFFCGGRRVVQEFSDKKKTCQTYLLHLLSW